jgi:hypothetical protein
MSPNEQIQSKIEEMRAKLKRISIEFRVENPDLVTIKRVLFNVSEELEDIFNIVYRMNAE